MAVITSAQRNCLLLCFCFLEIICLIRTTSSFQEDPHCGVGDFHCGNGQCILLEWKCDLDPDCDDHSDEDVHLCSNVTCLADYFSCQNGAACIPQSWKCDGNADCSNGFDEQHCDTRQCTADEFRCQASNTCISARWRCDQDDDCDDYSDEANCERQTCSNTTHFTCKNGRCIPLSWLCDGDNDCLDHSDELSCDADSAGHASNVVCHGKSKEFMCASLRECIHLAWRCDGEKDCLDGSDENMTMCGITSCSPDNHQCYDGSCISIGLRCDGVEHCQDGSDEALTLCVTERRCDPQTQFDCTGRGRQCINLNQVCNKVNDCGGFEDENITICDRSRANDCLVNKGGCSHYCNRTRVGYYCSCPSGFTLSNDSHSCVDINECLIPGTCSHICNNTIGGYKCHCNPGYLLSPRDHRCRAEGQEPMLLYANRHDIRMMGVHSRHHQSLIDNLRSAVAIDYDYSESKIYWSDVASEKIMWTSLKSDAVANTLVERDISTPDGLAVDWVHKNLYWTDTGNNRIEVVSLMNTEWRQTLIRDGMDEPRAIVVDPRTNQRYMYWSDWGDVARIERAVLDGSDRQAIVTQGLQWPNGLTIDYETNKLFWIDAKLHLVGSSDLNGLNQQVILMSSEYIKHPFAITVFEDSLYWSDWDSESILKASKYHMTKLSGANVTRAVMQVVSPMDVHVFHHLKQPAAVNACATSGCNQLCLPSRTKYRCLCSDRSSVAYHLGSDGKTCISSPHVSASTDSSSTTSENIRQKTSPSSVAKFAILGVFAAITLALSAVGISILIFRWYRRNSNKAFNFDNPVYRRTTTESSQFTITHRLQQPKLSSLTEPLTSSVDS